ncbi:MAG: M48 family metallopeptidase [Thermoanaerobaculia bacterium]
MQDGGGNLLRNRGCSRLMIALVIAVVGIIAYMSRTEVNPVTGEKQHVALSVDQEKVLGLEAAPEMADRMGGEVDPNDPQARMVQEVGQRVVAKSNAASSPYAGNFQFHLLADPETINAFALPGGQIFITRGLYDKLRDEAELSGVLGHEVGHVIHRHSAEQMAKGQLGAMLSQAVGVAASDGSGSGQNAALIAAMVNQMVQMKYGRGDESESDRYGIDAMAEAGYDPKAMLEVMEILKQASAGPRQPEWLSSHPLPETRIAEIQEYLRQKGAGGGPVSEGRPLN